MLLKTLRCPEHDPAPDARGAEVGGGGERVGFGVCSEGARWGRLVTSTVEKEHSGNSP